MEIQQHQIGSMKARDRFKSGAEIVRKRLEEGLHKGSALEFTELCLEVTRQTDIKHNTKTDPEFYNELFDSVVGSLQEPTKLNAMLVSAMNYMKEIKFAGYGPRFSTNVALGDTPLEDVEPIFDVVVQDEDVVPEETLAFTFGITKDFQVRFNAYNLAFLRDTKEKKPGTIVVDEPKPKKAKQQPQPARKVGNGKRK